MITAVLTKLFTKKGNCDDPAVRLSYGTMSGCVGVTVNVILFILKLIIGLVSGSIAIAADAVNNLSDAGSALVTLFGFKISAQPADEEHPFGHGRVEYLAGVIVAVLIIAVGLDFLKGSIMKTISPEDLNISTKMLIIYASSMLFKVWLFFFYRTISRKIKSKAIEAAAFDSLSDLLGMGVALTAVILFKVSGLPCDGPAGIIVAIIVIWGGIKVLREAASPLVGETPDPELVNQLQKKLLTCSGIKGVHGIIIHNYGPNLYFATAHAEVSCHGDLVTMHDTLESAEVEVRKALPIRLVLHCDPFNTEDPYVKDWRAKLENTVFTMNNKFKVFDFTVDDSEQGKRKLRFQLLVPKTGALSYDEISQRLTQKMKTYDPEIKLEILFLQTFV